jgi:outer membrane protein OmpA-like peptidoglycan-associated protein
MRVTTLFLSASLIATTGLGLALGCNASGSLQMGQDTTPSAASAAPTPTPTPTPTPSAAPHVVAATLPSMVGSKIDIQGQVLFNENADTFKADASGPIEAGTLAILQQVAKVMSDHPEITSLRVEGYTDNNGPAAYNIDLSQRRANTVIKWLSTTGAVDAARLSAKGCGQVNPIADNKTNDGQSKNRRSEFHIASTSGQPYQGDTVCGGQS